MALRALGMDVSEDAVNDVLGALPRRGASWTQLIEAAGHFGFRVTLVAPATIELLKSWTDRGLPVIIGWNPQRRDWWHASVVFDVDDHGRVWIADPNDVDPERTVRVLTREEFLPVWTDRLPDGTIVRPAAMLEREVDANGVRRDLGLVTG